MRTLTVVCLIAAAVLMLAACAPAAAPTAPPAEPAATAVSVATGADLAGTSWMLSSLKGSLPLPGTTVTLAFGADGSLSGTDGCNQFRGTYTQDGDLLTVEGPLASSMMACEEAIMAQAAAYTAALTATTAFTATGTQLILRSDSEILATFVAQSQSLDGTSWEVVGYNNGRQAVVSLVDGTQITANFGADGQLTGNAGCNRYFAEYTAEDGALTIGPAGTTRIFCDTPAGVMDQETEYLAALVTVATYGWEGDLMVLRTADGATAVQMRPAQAVEAPVEPAPEPAGVSLAGTSWVLSALDGSMPLEGTKLTLAFGSDGSLSGTDGCNQFRGGYTQAGEELAIEPMASTMMACEPAIMAQAESYIKALSATTGFTATETDLTLRSGDQTRAVFAAQSQSLADTFWEVVGYNNGRQAVVSLINGTEITADFGGDGQMGGNAGCNEYFAGYTAADGAMAISEIGSTFRLCDSPEGVMQQEGEYLVALTTVATYGWEGNLMVLRTADGATAVQLAPRVPVDLPEPEPAAPWGRVTAPQGVNVRSGPGTNFPVIGFALQGDEGPIVGRSADGRWWATVVPSAPDGIGWVSVDFVAAVDAEDVMVIEVAPPPVAPPTAAPAATATRAPATATPGAEIAFWADRTSINRGQCATLNWSVNNVQAVWVYPRGEAYHRFPRAGQGSETVCPATTTTYEMRVLMRDGSVVMREVTINVTQPAPTATPVPAPTATPVPPPTAVPTAQPDPLAGTRWEVIQYNNFWQGLATLVPGSRMTMEFGTDDRLTGNSGCNSFFGNYQASGNTISISQFGSTQQFCAEPEGVMEQEAEFLAALPNATSFRLDGDRLDLRDTNDQFIAILNRIQ